MDHKALQCFLGFANFYRRFIRNYSTITSALTTRVRFLWDQEAEEAFPELKRRFTTAPILIHPDPDSQFVVEVDACPKARLGFQGPSLCFLLAPTIPAEQNYDISNKELLAIKLALEE